MKKIGLAFLVLPGFLAFTGCTTSQNFQNMDRSVDMSVREISAKSNADILQTINDAKSAVVGISVDLSNGYAVGSGVAISSGGYILTNYHVVEGGSKITLYFADKTTGSANLVWSDPSIDMAVLRSSREIPYLATESLDNTFVGEEVYAIGTPLTLEFKHTVTKGIVSAKDRTLESESDLGTSFLQSLVQHDASINPGNSGGPLINVEGKVVGLNTLKASEGEGIAFAIPIRLGKIVVEKLTQNSYYKTPYIGVFAFDSSLAQIYGQSLTSDGVYVVSVVGPAKTAGLKEGDLITEIDGEKIANMLDFRSVIYQKDVGDNILVTFNRNGVYKTTNITLTRRG